MIKDSESIERQRLIENVFQFCGLDYQEILQKNARELVEINRRVKENNRLNPFRINDFADT